jgi:hypothetical protein
MSMDGRTRLLGMCLAGMVALGCGARQVRAQASALPSAQVDGDQGQGNRGRKLLDEMVQALGGDKWLHRTTWFEAGKVGTFYKGTPDPYVNGFEEYDRAKPFGRRVVIVSHFGVFIPSDHRDVAVVYTPTDAFEVTYKGKKQLPKDELQEYLLQRKYAFEVIMNDWAQQPGVLISYEGTDMVDRRLTDRVSILTTDNQSAVLQLDETTHLPLSRTVVYRDALYHDQDTDVEQYDNYQTFQGIATPMTITRLHNGDIVAQRFLTKVDYSVKLSDDLFDPDRPLMKKAKK